MDLRFWQVHAHQDTPARINTRNDVINVVTCATPAEIIIEKRKSKEGLGLLVFQVQQLLDCAFIKLRLATTSSQRIIELLFGKCPTEFLSRCVGTVRVPA
ncbi:hypothetical protein DZK27_09215 [Rhodobacteraceae bacterium 63075]|nr:hypothetical protein DZK27_09215 [Rhodobacteraceae bacterium 63075]